MAPVTSDGVQIQKSVSVGGGGGATTTDKKGKEKKLGHRRVWTDDGQQLVTYKKFETTQLIGSIQLGIQHSVGSLASVDSRSDGQYITQFFQSFNFSW